MVETSEYEDLDRVDETEMYCLVVDDAQKGGTGDAKPAQDGPEAASETPEVYIPATIRELNRAAGTDKYTADTDFEHEEPESPKAPEKQEPEPAPKKKNPIEILKGLKRKK